MEFRVTPECSLACCFAAHSIQWGAWDGVGMAASSKATLVRIKRSGMGAIAPTAGLAALAAILAPAGPLNAQVPELPARVLARMFLCWQGLAAKFRLARAGT